MNNYRNKLLCIRLLGGLGNQLFIYAFAKAYSLKHGCKIVYDLETGFKNDNYGRIPKLDKYVSDLFVASHFHHLIFYFTKLFPKIAKVLFGSEVILEESSRTYFKLDDKLLNGKLFFIQGYFQSHLYFKDYDEQIRSSINLRIPKPELIKDIANSIEGSNSVSIHIRRLQYSHLLELDYYNDAINYMNANTENPEYFVFSDDIDWCIANITTDKKISFVVHEEKDEVADLWLMSLCKNHIIANSSFSWWGAWLCKNKQKIVVSPQNIQIGVKDKFYPEDWIII